MKALAVLALSFLFVPAAFAQSAAQSTPSSALPPPGINDPGVKPAAPALPAMRDDGRDARGQTPPEVKVHQEGDNTVQEYVRNGQLYMVVITPRSGPAQTYMVDPQGRLIDEHGKKTVSPVMYKLLEWGKSKPAEATTGGE
jgi:hypothetical protein